MERLKEVNCNIDVDMNLMLVQNSGTVSDLALWVKCFCTDKDNWIGYTNKKCVECKIEHDLAIFLGIETK